MYAAHVRTNPELTCEQALIAAEPSEPADGLHLLCEAAKIIHKASDGGVALVPGRSMMRKTRTSNWSSRGSVRHPTMRRCEWVCVCVKNAPKRWRQHAQVPAEQRKAAEAEAKRLMEAEQEDR